MSPEDKTKLYELKTVTVDTTLSITSENPVQNNVITEAIENIKTSLFWDDITN